MATGMVQVPLEWSDDWAHGNFQDAYESVRSWHRVGVRMLEWAGSTARKRVVPRELSAARDHVVVQ